MKYCPRDLDKVDIPESDKELISQVFDMYDFQDVDMLKGKAISDYAKDVLKSRSSYLYHREEYDCGIL